MKTQRCVLRMAYGMARDHISNDVDGSVTMVKTELRKTIQLRREAKGLGSVEVHNQGKKKTVELSEEEIEKIKSRRERNRLSAQKCRKRRREQLVNLSQEASNIEEANGMLEREIEYLKMEKEQLSRMLHGHYCNISRRSGHSHGEGVVPLLVD